MNRLPYRRNYGRMLIAVGILATVVYPAIPKEAVGATAFLRAFVGTFGFGLALLWAPVVLYVGLRTKCAIEIAFGVTGMLTLVFWIPNIMCHLQ